MRIEARAIVESGEIIEPLRDRIIGRVTLEKIVDPLSGDVIADVNDDIDEEKAQAIQEGGIEKVRIRSVLTCASRRGCCAKCYGRDLATGRLVELGLAVGVIAAQSIGEPGTQLTMRTFHTGGVAGSDIAGGLPRVVELFEARTPRGAARLAKAAGAVRIGEDEGKGIPVSVVDDDGEEHEGILTLGARPIVRDGDELVGAGPSTTSQIEFCAIAIRPRTGQERVIACGIVMPIIEPVDGGVLIKLPDSSVAGCSKCHTMRGVGGTIGPDLSNLPQRDYAPACR